MSDRKKQLQARFNDFFKDVLGENINLYDKLSTKKFVELKKVISCINNIITLQVTEKFAVFLEQQHIINSKQKNDILAQINAVNANANGYDIQYTEPILKGKGLLAEIKCNIPVNATSFGAAQLAGIIKDINGLKNGKHKAQSKAQIEDSDAYRKILADYYKFMVFLDGDRVQNAVDKLLKSNLDIPTAIFPSDIQELHTETVYIVILSID